MTQLLLPGLMIINVPDACNGLADLRDLVDELIGNIEAHGDPQLEPAAQDLRAALVNLLRAEALLIDHAHAQGWNLVGLVGDIRRPTTINPPNRPFQEGKP